MTKVSLRHSNDNLDTPFSRFLGLSLTPHPSHLRIISQHLLVNHHSIALLSFIIMNYSPRSPTYSNGQTWDTSGEMLASSMMLVAISENSQAVNVGYRSNLSSEGNLSRGWGSALSRKSYKTDLSSLAGSSSQASCSMQSASTVTSDDWGYFVGN
jgi:hypothetical protein